ncbi:MAG: RNA degradosome polyphosphate kinase, partial [Planctomycetota bacterium]|nr:RNA degradosome polyphosphate kinase [Planctomycetota bacterium]
IVRGICRLRPGVPGVSENIRVRSLVGRFLEHARVFWFHHGGAPLLYLSSADWMERNLHNRIEVAFPIETAAMVKRIHEEVFESQLADTAQAWSLRPDGSYERVESSAPARVSAQRAVLEKHARIKQR